MRVALSCLFVLAAACSSNDTTTTNPGIDAGGKDSSAPQDSGGQPDAGGPTINGCGPADFKPANTITWSFTVSPACVSIKPGDSVTWNGQFGTHPLDAFNGDSPNPIAGAGMLADGGTSVTVKFPTAGTFGFHCNNHPSMLGAVKVAP